MKAIRFIAKITIVILFIFVGLNLIIAAIDYVAKRRFVEACQEGWQKLSEKGMHPINNSKNPDLFIFSDNSQIPIPSEFENARHCYFRTKDGPGVFKDIGENLP